VRQTRGRTIYQIPASPQHVTQQFLHVRELLGSLEIYVVSRAHKSGEKVDKDDFESSSALIARWHGGWNAATAKSRDTRQTLFPITEAHKGDGPALEMRLNSRQ